MRDKDPKDHKDKDDNHKEHKKHVSKRWISCEVETDYFGDDRKLNKADRKMASAKDRSQYKKSDRDQQKKAPEQVIVGKEKFLRGRVLSITPRGIIVEHEKTLVLCVLRGLLKKEKTQFKNLITVGDFVLFEKSTPDEGTIHHVEPRRSVLSRADNLSRRKEQLIASNIDQVLITTSVVEPPLKPFLVDRYIIAARKGGMQPIIVVNKIDLLQDLENKPELAQEAEIYREFIAAYAAIQIPVITVSAETNEGIDDLRDVMRDKASVFSGQSGVGKSSLINAVAGHELEIGSIVGKTKKGSHTTTTANLLPLSFGGWCIDTPGIKSFGLWDLKLDEIESYFSEIHDCGSKCKYPDCSHSQEAGCAVVDAVEKGEISPLRYQSYLYLIESVSREHKRR